MAMPSAPQQTWANRHVRKLCEQEHCRILQYVQLQRSSREPEDSQWKHPLWTNANQTIYPYGDERHHRVGSFPARVSRAQEPGHSTRDVATWVIVSHAEFPDR